MIVGGLLALQEWKQIDYAMQHWNDPVAVRRLSTDPIAGRVFEARYNEKLAEENLRRWNDRYKYTGETWKNSPYPWTSYYNTEGSRSFGAGDYFEASEAIISQNLVRLKRWY